jgi:hypothetical protein
MKQPIHITRPAVTTDRSEALDRLLEARGALADVRNSTLPGLPLYEAVASAIRATDEAMKAIKGMAA